LPLYREAALKKLASPEDLDRLLKITNVRAWLLLAALSCLLLAAFAWGVWGSINTTVEASGVLVQSTADTLEAITYVSLSDAQQLDPGMPVDLLPFGVRQEVHGTMRGTVRSVAQQAASRSEMVTTLGNSALIDSLIRAEEVFAVHVDLEASPNGGYRWTISDAPDLILPAQTPVSLSIIVRREPPISRLFASA
jgi:hypothetical protein